MSRVPKRKIVIRRGDTYTHGVTETNNDLTGSSFLVQLKTDPTDTVPVVTFTSTILDAVQGKWQFSLTAVQTAAIPVGSYVYDVQRTFSDGSVRTRFQGEAEVEQDVSRA